jgi:hypothetical protein
LDPHNGIVVEKSSGILSVGANTADNGRQVQDDMWLRLGIETDDRIAIAQIILLRTRNSDILTTPLSLLLHDE